MGWSRAGAEAEAEQVWAQQGQLSSPCPPAQGCSAGQAAPQIPHEIPQGFVQSSMGAGGGEVAHSPRPSTAALSYQHKAIVLQVASNVHTTHPAVAQIHLLCKVHSVLTDARNATLKIFLVIIY